MASLHFDDLPCGEIPTQKRSSISGLVKMAKERERLLKPQTVEETLEQRRKHYGPFIKHAKYADAINKVFETSPNWEKMQPDAREALRSIAGKIARILNGDPDYDDNWRDIAGYATLVEKRINGNNE